MEYYVQVNVRNIGCYFVDDGTLGKERNAYVQFSEH
jgi:hypothetical protein